MKSHSNRNTSSNFYPSIPGNHLKPQRGANICSPSGAVILVMNQTGIIGENAAVALLEAKGYRIAARNWRFGKSELDIIAWAHDRLLVFVEVKTRTGQGRGYGGPEGAIDAKKQERLLHAAGSYMESVGYDWEIRFDTVAVMLSKQQTVLEIKHLEDVFYPM